MTADTALPTAPAATAARPGTLTAGAVLALLQGLVIALYGVYLLVAGLVGHPRTGVGLTEFGGLIVLLMGLLPLAAGRALLRLRRWGRSPAVMMDTLCLAVAYFTFKNGGAQIPIGILVGLYGLAGIVLLLHPRTTAVLWPTAPETAPGTAPETTRDGAASGA